MCWYPRRHECILLCSGTARECVFLSVLVKCTKGRIMYTFYLCAEQEGFYEDLARGVRTSKLVVAFVSDEVCHPINTNMYTKVV